MVISIDFETQKIPFFDKGGKKKDHKGHPRHAKPKMLTAFDGKTETLLENLPLAFDIRDKEVVCHNLSFDWPTGKNGAVFKGEPKTLHCTRVMAKLLDDTCSAKLKPLAEKHLGASVISYQEAERAGGEVFRNYAINDAVFTFKLFDRFSEQLKAQGMWDLYKIERDFLAVNSEVENTGVKIDETAMKRLSRLLKNEIQDADAKLERPGLNWRSSKQMKQLLYRDLKLPVVLDKGKPSTSKYALEKLESHHPLVGQIMDLREKDSLRKSLDSYTRFVDPATGAIYPYIDTLGTHTGRATSKHPNMQNQKKDPRFRSLFVARPGYSFVGLDFSQIEPRVLAHFAGEGRLKELFFSEGDFYSNFSSIIFDGLPRQPERSTSKLLILAITYGMSPFTVARILSVPVPTAKNYFERVLRGFPEIQKFREQVLEKARQTSYAEGLLGRRRMVSTINSSNEWVRAKAERQAFNAVIQGSAATIFKKQVNELRAVLPTEIRFVGHCHDSVLLEVPEKLTKEVYATSKQTLEKPISWFSVPLVATGGTGKTWAETEE